MTTAQPAARTSLESRRRDANLRCLVWGLGIGVCASAAEGVMHHGEFSVGLRLALSLSPLLPAVMFARSARQALAATDELQRLIEQQASYFALLALWVVFVCVDLLQHADLLADSFWTSGRLTIAVALLYVVGRVGAWLRYR